MIGLLLVLGDAVLGEAHAEPLSYEAALVDALSHNATLQIAEAGARAAEGSLTAAQGTWDPLLGAEGWYAPMVSEGRSQSAQYRLDMSTFGVGTDLSQQLPSGTGVSLNWRATRIPSSTYDFSVVGQEFSEEVPNTYTTELTASLSQQLLEGHKMAYNLQQVRRADHGWVRAKAELSSARQQVIAQVAVGYWDLVVARSALGSARRSIAVAEEEQRVVKALVEAGTLARVDLTRVAAALAQARLEGIQAEHTAVAASDALLLLLGRDPGQDLVPSSPPGDVPLGLDLNVERAVAAALSGNPDLALARMDLEAAEAEVDWARHALLPELTATGTFGVSGYEEGEFSAAMQELFSRALPSHYVGLRMSAPVGNRAARGALQAQMAQLEIARRGVEQQERSVASDAAAQARIVGSARRQVELAELNLNLAEETLAAEKARQAVGRAIQKDVLEVQRARARAEVSLVEARTGYRKALVSLEALQGGL